MIEAPFAQIYSKAIAEHIAQTGAIDVIDRSPRLDPGLRRSRSHRPDRRPHQEVQGAVDPERLPPALPRPDELQGQDLGILRRRRRLEPLLPQGHLRQRQAQVGVQGEVQAKPPCPEDLGRVRGDLAVHHRPDGPARCTGARGPRARESRQPVLLLPAVPRARRGVLQSADHEGADQQRDRRQDHAVDHARAQGFAARNREAELRRLLGEVAAGQDGDDLRLAADRTNLRELRTARQVVLVPAEVEDRQARSATRSCRNSTASTPARASLRLGGLEEPGGRLPVHAMGDQPVDLAPARAAAVHAARPVPDLALQVEAVPVALAGGGRVPEGPQRRREQRGTRPDHDRCGRLRQRARPRDDGDVRREGHQVGARRHRQGVGSHHGQAGCREAASLVRGVPEAPRLDQQEHGREEGPRRSRSRPDGAAWRRTRRQPSRGGGHGPPPRGWTGTSAGCWSRRPSFWCSR